MAAVERLIDHWRQYETGARPALHPADRSVISGVSGLHLNAEPYPFVGDVAGADIWFLMLNSNVGDADAVDEAHPVMGELIRRNLAQEWQGVDYPFFSLHPALQHTGTYRYYNGRCAFGQLIEAFAARAGVSVEGARRIVANRVAVVQYFHTAQRVPIRATPGSNRRRAPGWLSRPSGRRRDCIS